MRGGNIRNRDVLWRTEFCGDVLRSGTRERERREQHGPAVCNERQREINECGVSTSRIRRSCISTENFRGVSTGVECRTRARSGIISKRWARGRSVKRSAHESRRGSRNRINLDTNRKSPIRAFTSRDEAGSPQRLRDQCTPSTCPY